MNILVTLRQRGGLSLREAHEAFCDYGQPVGYTTMQTRLNRLVRKGAARWRDEVL